MLLYITLHSLYLCRLFTFIGANIFFGRQLCLPAHIRSRVLCNALSHLWPAWLETCCYLQSLLTASGGNLKILNTRKGCATWCPGLQQSCSSLCRDIDCYRTIIAGNIIGLVIFGAFLKSPACQFGSMGILLFTVKEEVVLKICHSAVCREKKTEGLRRLIEMQSGVYDYLKQLLSSRACLLIWRLSQ